MRITAIFPTTLLLSLVLLSVPDPLRAQPENEPLTPEDSVARAILDSLMLADTVQPQLRVGLFSGINFSTAHVEYIPLAPEVKNGFHGGLRAEMEFAYPVYFLFEAEYSQRGVHSEYESNGGTILRETYKFNYLSFPIMFRLGVPLTPKFEVSAGFGAVPGILVARTQSVSFEDADTSFSISKGLEEFDFGLEYRLGLEYFLSPRHSITFDGRYFQGLQNLLIPDPTRKDDRVWKNRALSFSLGIMYQLQRSIR